MSTTLDARAIESRHDDAISEATDGLQIDHWVGGERAGSGGDDRFETIDPAVGSPITDVARGGATEIDAAVEAARAAYDDHWRETTPFERADVVRDWVDELRDHSDELARLESLDTGKPIQFARDEIEDAFDYFEYYVSVAQDHTGKQLPRGPDGHYYTRSEPYGVAGQILPWNYPLNLFGWKVGAALAAGNTAVVKPSEEAPLSITRAAQLSEGILPDGVLNVVNGYGDAAGAPLAEHDGVDKLSFTGSVPVGRAVMHAAADHVTPVTLELGGKSPFVVFEDADLTAAARSIAAGIFYNTGQSCDACSRVLVQEAVHDEFMDEFLSAVEFWQPGDPLAGDVNMGPLTFEAQLAKVEEYVGIGTADGAELVAGGERIESGGGFYYEPTVFDDVDNGARIAQEEIFGPVECVITFSEYEEAISLANDVEYGLAAGVATTDASRAHRAAADILAGSVWINQYHGGGPGVPFGGYKASGFGRECAAETLDEYTHSKAVGMQLEER